MSTARAKRPIASRSKAKVERTAASRKKLKPAGELKIVETRVYRGPNYWSCDPAIKLVVDLGVLEQFPSSTIPASSGPAGDAARGRHHSCSTGRVGGFERVCRRDLAGPRGRARGASSCSARLAPRSAAARPAAPAIRVGTRRLLVRRGERRPGRRPAGRASGQPPRHRGAGLRLPGRVRELVLLAERAAFGPSTQAILDEASLRDIPSIRLNEQSLVQARPRRHQQRIRATMTSQTGSLGVDIASDKS